MTFTIYCCIVLDIYKMSYKNLIKLRKTISNLKFLKKIIFLEKNFYIYPLPYTKIVFGFMCCLILIFKWL